MIRCVRCDRWFNSIFDFESHKDFGNIWPQWNCKR